MSTGRTTILIPVSPSELLDRLAIATIRCQQLCDGPEHQAAIRRRETLEFIRASHLSGCAKTTHLFQALLECNRQLWQLEDRVRQLRDLPEHRCEFIELAYQIFAINDQRSELKRKIDREYGVAGETKVFRPSLPKESGVHAQ